MAAGGTPVLSALVICLHRGQLLTSGILVALFIFCDSQEAGHDPTTVCRLDGTTVVLQGVWMVMFACSQFTEFRDLTSEKTVRDYHQHTHTHKLYCLHLLFFMAHIFHVSSHLFLRHLNGLPKNCPDDNLRARRCGETAQVPVVFACVRWQYRSQIEGIYSHRDICNKISIFQTPS